MQARLADIAALLGAELVGNADTIVTRIGTLEDADAATIGFIANPRYATLLGSTRAGCVIVSPALREAAAARGAALVATDPHGAFARLTRWWVAQSRRMPERGVHRSAVVEEGAVIDAGASVAAFAFVGRGAHVAAGAEIGPHCVVGDDVRLGQGTRLRPRVTIEAGCILGARGLVHSGAVIGADGFGFAPRKGEGTGEGGTEWDKVEQLGTVVIGDDVEIGANTCIDRGALADTVLGHGVKLDNLVMIAHNVRIGEHTAFAGCAAVAGSARIGRWCTVGGAASILGHLEIVDHVHITACTLISRSIRQAGQYSGAFPFDDNASWEKNAATLRQLHHLRDRLRALEKKANQTP
jgi:UDP-3-O-[3-hydroxymyristoyl] glucosamine N-acyltransferase